MDKEKSGYRLHLARAYRYAGKEKRLALGVFPEVSLN